MLPSFLWRAWLAFAVLSGLLAGCATPTADPGSAPRAGVVDFPSPVTGTATSAARGWEHRTLPNKRPSEFQFKVQDGRQTVRAVAESSASFLRYQVRVEPESLGSLRFGWKVSSLIAASDFARREADDGPVRIVLAFEGDRSRFSAKDAMLSELARVVTGDEMPYATLMYVWCNKRSPGTVVRNAHTDRIRKLVVESGPSRLDEWLEYERDVRADFERAFGEPPGALVGIALMTDSDNTKSSTSAWYTPVRLVRTGRP